MSCELTVTIKGEERTYKQNFLLYEEFKWSEEDPIIKQCVEEALANAKIEPDDIKVRGLLVLR